MIDHEGGFGFVETAEGEVYFHRNSVVEGGSRSLEPGSRVRLEIAERESGEGWQAHHGPPDRQASPAGRTGLIRLRARQFASWKSPQRSRLATGSLALRDFGVQCEGGRARERPGGRRTLIYVNEALARRAQSCGVTSPLEEGRRPC